MTNLSVDEAVAARCLEMCADASAVFFRDKNTPNVQYKADFTRAPIVLYEPITDWPAGLSCFQAESMSFSTLRSLIESRVSSVYKFWTNGNACSLPPQMEKLVESLSSSEKRDAEIKRFAFLKKHLLHQ